MKKKKKCQLTIRVSESQKRRIKENSKLCLNKAKPNISKYLLHLDDMYNEDKNAFKLLLADKILPKIFNMEEFEIMQRKFKNTFLEDTKEIKDTYNLGADK